MPHQFTLLAASAMIAATLSVGARADVTFPSSAERTHLLELFSSEGCCGCPPAEKGLSQLRQSPRLWKDFVPLAFHVDYWDLLRRPDRSAVR